MMNSRCDALSRGFAIALKDRHVKMASGNLSPRFSSVHEFAGPCSYVHCDGAFNPSACHHSVCDTLLYS